MATTTERHIIEVGIHGSDSAASELAALSAAARRAMKGISDALDSLQSFKSIKVNIDTKGAIKSIRVVGDAIQRDIIDRFGSAQSPLLGYNKASVLADRARSHNQRASRTVRNEFTETLISKFFPYRDRVSRLLLGYNSDSGFSNSDLQNLDTQINMREGLSQLRQDRDIRRRYMRHKMFPSIYPFTVSDAQGFYGYGNTGNGSWPFSSIDQEILDIAGGRRGVNNTSPFLLGYDPTVGNFTNSNLDDLERQMNHRNRIRLLRRRLQAYRRSILRNMFIGGASPLLGYHEPNGDTLPAQYQNMPISSNYISSQHDFPYGYSGIGNNIYQNNIGHGGFFSSLRNLGSMLQRLTIVVKAAIFPYVTLYKLAKRLMALFGVKENFRLYKDANIAGMLRGGDATGLLQQQRISTLLGGDAASISAMMGRIASERAMLAYGGKGGSFMEAARLFGVNIFGSGRYGFATNEEYLNNIAAAMGRLDPEGRLALARTAGLTSEQFWAMRGGTASWSKYTSSNSTLLERLIKSVEKADFWLGKQNERFRKTAGNDLPFFFKLSDMFTSSGGAWHGEVVAEWNRSWGALKSTVSEFVLVLGDAVLPLLSTLCDFLSILIQMITAFISPFAKFISYIGRFTNGFFNPGTWDSLFKNGAEAERAIDNTPQAIRLRRSDWDDTGNSSGVGNRSISVNNVTINARSPSEARDFMQGMIDGAASSDYMNMENNGMSAVA